MENALNDPAIPWKGISELIEQAGTSQNKHDFMNRMLEGVGTLIPYDFGSGVLSAGGQYIASYGLDSKTVEEYNGYYIYKMGFLPQSLNESFRDGSQNDLLPVNWNLYPDTEFVADFVRPRHIGSTLINFLPQSALSLMMHRNQQTVLFNNTEKITLLILNSHMHNYLNLYDNLDFSTPQIPGSNEIRERFPKLSARESEVVRQTCIGFSAAIISKRLGVSRRTVESQLLSAYQKLNVETKKELVRTVVDSFLWKPKNE